jgi:hypothetical protein
VRNHQHAGAGGLDDAPVMLGDLRNSPFWLSMEFARRTLLPQLTEKADNRAVAARS